MSKDADDRGWGYFRRPVLLGPSVGFIAVLAAEAVRSPSPPDSADGLIWLPLFLVIATIFAAIPYLLGAFLLLAICRALPSPLVSFIAFRLILGGLVGALIAWPFTNMLNWIPSFTAEPRFKFNSILAGCVVGGAYCAAFFATPAKQRAGTA